MSEPIPESIPTSQDPRTKRVTKKRALSPGGFHAAQVDALFSRPDREVVIPESATADGKPRGLAPPPEIVANVQGSSAGAGSGEFHVYKASRRKEFERLRMMDEEVEKEKADAEYARKAEEIRQRDSVKTNKNRAKREKMKARKQAAANGVTKQSEAKPKAAKPGLGRALEQSRENGNMQRSPGPEAPPAVVPEEPGVIIHDDD